MTSASSTLPAHYDLTRGQAVFAVVSIATATALLAWLAFRLATAIELTQWWIVPALVAGITAADFGSGVVHWAADTWGRDDCPLIGPRLLVPFRVHHLNPDDFLRRRFVDANGELAFVAIPLLIALLALPLRSASCAVLAVFGLAFCAFGAMTNQIHQWAHTRAPVPIRCLQQCGILLGTAEHAAHHDRPYDCHYCITTGWCNGALDAIQFFRRLERTITFITGVLPRDDDRRYQERYGAALRSVDRRE